MGRTNAQHGKSVCVHLWYVKGVTSRQLVLECTAPSQLWILLSGVVYWAGSGLQQLAGGTVKSSAEVVTLDL